jgi:hypothetical protein
MPSKMVSTTALLLGLFQVLNLWQSVTATATEGVLQASPSQVSPFSIVSAFI